MSETIQGAAASVGDAPRSAQHRAARITAILDDMPRIGLGPLATAALLVTFLFANYDISVVSITLPSISASLGLKSTDLSWPVTLNLIGYAVGAYIVGHIGDRRGRLAGLRITIVVLTVDGVLTAFSWNLATFTLFRFICGCGMGAVLSLAGAYVGELAPKNRRGRYLTTIYLMQVILLTLIGFGSLPVLDLGPVGWRILIGFGALVIIALPAMGTIVPESPRWLAAVGRLDEAETIVTRLAKGGFRGESIPAHLETAPPESPVAEEHAPLRELLSRPLLGRVLLVSGFWFFFYVGFYAFSSYQPLLLEGLGVTVASAIWLTVLGRSSGVLSYLLLLGIIERFERKTIVLVSAAAVVVSFLLLITGWGPWTFVVANLLYTFALGVLVPPAFTYSAEIFPTRARGTAAAIGDGVGHLGGAVAPFVVLPILAAFGALPAMLALTLSVVVAIGCIAFGPTTKGKALSTIAR